MNVADGIQAVAVKRLVVVDLPDLGSNQHEVNGVNALRELFGTEKTQGAVQWHYFADNQDPITDEGRYTFYDARENHPTRTEWRLYYSGDFLSYADPGDVLVLIRNKPGDLHALVLQEGSNWMRSAIRLFAEVGEATRRPRVIGKDQLQSHELDFTDRRILESLGFEITETEATHEDLVIERFGDEFPSTREMSAFAREVVGDVDLGSPDELLIWWINREEELFRALERIVVRERIEEGFDSVDEFISFSLSVQNRRKARMGHAFEHQLAALFRRHNLQFDRQKRTEGKNKPDFLFPGIDAYRNPSFGPNFLTMLGAKSTCKDRWRQILTEADRIDDKHLCTLEPGISEAQTDEMKNQNVIPVVPEPLHDTYTSIQLNLIWSVETFVGHVKDLQKHAPGQQTLFTS